MDGKGLGWAVETDRGHAADCCGRRFNLYLRYLTQGGGSAWWFPGGVRGQLKLINARGVTVDLATISTTAGRRTVQYSATCLY